MPEFESLRYTSHAISRMNERKLSQFDVELAIRSGDSWIDDDGLWICELHHIRVVVREERDVGIVITAMRLRGRD